MLDSLQKDDLMPYFSMDQFFDEYLKTSIISHTLVSNKIVDNSDVVGAAPTTSSFST